MGKKGCGKLYSFDSDGFSYPDRNEVKRDKTATRPEAIRKMANMGLVRTGVVTIVAAKGWSVV